MHALGSMVRAVALATCLAASSCLHTGGISNSADAVVCAAAATVATAVNVANDPHYDAGKALETAPQPPMGFDAQWLESATCVEIPPRLSCLHGSRAHSFAFALAPERVGAEANSSDCGIV